MALCFVAVEFQQFAGITEKSPDLTRPIKRDNLINRCCFHAIDNIIAFSRDKVPIGEYLDLFLWASQYMVQLAIYKDDYSIFKLFP
jgi:hypothetical protein